MKFVINAIMIVDETELGSVVGYIHRSARVLDFGIEPMSENHEQADPAQKSKPKTKPKVKKPTCRHMLLEALRDGPAKSGALSRLGVSKGFGASTAYTTLATMVKSGEVLRTYDGTYSLLNIDQDASFKV